MTVSPFRIPESVASALAPVDDRRLRMPRWYVLGCEALSRAVWRGHVTDREATVWLDVFHDVALREGLAER